MRIDVNIHGSLDEMIGAFQQGLSRHHASVINQDGHVSYVILDFLSCFLHIFAVTAVDDVGVSSTTNGFDLVGWNK